MKGYSLVEILVVIAIMAILGTVGYANYIAFSSNQILTDAVNKVQSLVRAAQTNATASVTNSGETCFNWSVVFATDKKTIKLICKTAAGEQEKSVLNLTNEVTVEKIVVGADATSCPSTVGTICSSTVFAAQPTYTATVIYSALYGQPTFILAKGVTGSECPDPNANPPAIPTARFIVTLKYERGSTVIRKDIRISRGGQIDVQC